MQQAFDSYSAIADQIEDKSPVYLSNSGDFQDALARTLLLAAKKSQWEEAAALLGYMAVLRNSGYYLPDLPLERKYVDAQEEIKDALPEEILKAALEKGSSFTLGEAIVFVQRLRVE